MSAATVPVLISPPAVPTGGPPLLTVEEFVRLHGDERVELVEGRVVELPMPHLKHGKICAKMVHLLGNYAEEHDSGHVASNDSFVLISRDPPMIRGADVLYYSYEQLPKGSVPDGLIPTPPSLVVEVRSPSDTWSKIFTKVGEYLDAGVRVVVVLDDTTTTASVYRDTELQQIFHATDEMTLPDVLPGFAVRVSRLFE